MILQYVVILHVLLAPVCYCTADFRRLYSDLLENGGYNKLIRPVLNDSETLTVYLGLRISQLIDVDEKNQVMTTNVWLLHRWNDEMLKWRPKDYGGIETINLPSEEIWVPDIVLYNNADGNYEVTLMVRAEVHYTGQVTWNPPVIYKSSCPIDVEFFPFDMQECAMKFRSWTYDGLKVDIQHIHNFNNPLPNDEPVDIKNGIELDNFERNVEWDVLAANARKNIHYQICCMAPLPDLTFHLTMRRKTLFYTVNLILPIVSMSFLTVLVFYLPSDSGEKIALCVSVLLALTVFFLLLAEIIPTTSLDVPLIGKYLLFTMILVTLSIIVTVVTLNIHFRQPSTHILSPWMRTVFLNVLPRMLLMSRPQVEKRIKKSKSKNRLEIEACCHDPTCSNNYVSEHGYYNPSYPDTPGHETAPGFADLKSGHCHHQDPSKNTTGGGKGGHSHYHPEAHHHAGHTYHAPGGGRGGPAGGHYHPSSHDGGHYHPDYSAEYGRHQGDRPGRRRKYGARVMRALEGVWMIADHLKDQAHDTQVKEDWKYVAMVMDRLFLWIFGTACIVGTMGIVMQAPMLYDTRVPITREEDRFAHVYETM